MDHYFDNNMKVKYHLTNEEVRVAIYNYAINMGAELPPISDMAIVVQDDGSELDEFSMYADIVPNNWNAEEEENSELEDDSDDGEDEDGDDYDGEEDEPEDAEKGQLAPTKTDSRFGQFR